MADGTLKVGTITNSAGSGNITIGSGVTLLSNTPAFEVYLNSTQTLTDDTSTKIQFDTVVFDTDSCWDTSNYRFLPTTAGKYMINLQISCQINAGDQLNYMYAKLYKNGTDLYNSNLDFRSNPGGYNNAKTVSVVCEMNGTSDYIEGFVQCDDATGNPDAQGVSGGKRYNWFTAYRLGA